MTNQDKLRFILMHILHSQVKVNDAPASAQSHMDMAIVELYKLIDCFEPQTDECKQALNEAIEHMRLYNKI